MSNHPFVPLRHRAVRLLWSAAVISDAGTWVQLVVVGSLVAAGTGSAVQTGLVALATFMPQGIASPIGGLLADRFDRRKVFACALFGQAVATTGLALVLGAGIRTPAMLTAFILVSSAAGAMGQPAYAAMLPDLVPPEELMAMVSLGVYSWNSGRIIGPMLGSVLALTVGPAWTVAFNAVSFVVMASAVLAVRRPFRGVVSDGTVTQRLAEGYRILQRLPGGWVAVVLLVLLNLTIVPFMGLIPIYATSVFHGGTGLVGVFSSTQGVGAIIGGIVVTVLVARRARSRVVLGLVVGVALSLASYALAPTVALAVAAVGVVGATWSALYIAISAVVQRDAPNEGRGRVMSIMQASGGVSYGLGLLSIGWLADTTNLRIAFLTGVVLMLVGFVVVTRRLPAWRVAIDGEAPLTEVGEVVAPADDLVLCVS